MLTQMAGASSDRGLTGDPTGGAPPRAPSDLDEAPSDLDERWTMLGEAQELAHIGYWTWEIPTDRIFWTDELFRIYGIDPTQFAASYEAFLGCIHEDDREFVNSTVQASFASGDPWQFEHRLRRPDGEVRWLRALGRVVQDANGAPSRMYGTAQDITQERANLDRLEASERRFRGLLEAAPDAVFIVARTGEINFANAQAEELFGYTREEFLSLRVEDLMPAAMRTRHTEHRERFTDHPSTRGMGLGLDLRATRKDGTEFPVDISLAPVEDSASTPESQVLTFVRDATAQRAQTEARIQRRQTLEINDRVVQGLATALRALETHDEPTAMTVLYETLTGAREMMASLSEAQIAPGDLVQASRAKRDAPRAGDAETDGMLRVVVADDTRAMRHMLRIILDESGGMTVVAEAEDGRSALDAVREQHPDLLLLDLAMPEMDGLQVLEHMRRDHPDTRVVVVSGYGRPQFEHRTSELGAIAFIEKGSPTESMIATLRDIRDSIARDRVSA